MTNDKKINGGFKEVGDRLTVELDESNLVKQLQHRSRLLEFSNTLGVEEFVERPEGSFSLVCRAGTISVTSGQP